MFANKPGSRRWTNLHSALQLAVQRSAHKWTFEDFAECFPLYVEEDKNGASATFNSISEYIEAQNLRDLDKLFKDYNVQESVDLLHKVVQEAKDRQENGTAGNDSWKEVLDPRVAVAARTMPVLTSEAERLRTMIAQVEAENRQLEKQLSKAVRATDDANEKVLELLDRFDVVLEQWEKLPHDEIEGWTVGMAESLKPVLRA